MSELFSACPSDIGDTPSASAFGTNDAPDENARYSVISKKQEKKLRQMCKFFKKHKKSIKKMAKQEAKKSASEKAEKTKKEEVKGFLWEFGKAVCKAVPMVLTTLTTLVFKFAFMEKRKGIRNGMQFA